MNFTERYNKRLKDPSAQWKNNYITQSPRDSKMKRASSNMLEYDANKHSNRFLEAKEKQKSLTRIFSEHR